MQHGCPVPDGFAHSYDAAAAHLQSGRADGPQGCEPVLIGPRRHDVWIEFGTRVEIVIIGRQPRLLQPLCLVCGQHAERHASLHPERANAAHHIEHRVERLSVAHIPPGRAHAKTIGSGGFRARREREHGLGFHHIGLVEANLAMMRGLRAIGAILRAAAGLDAEEARLLDVADIVKMPMNAVRLCDQIEQRQIVNCDDLVRGPIVPEELAGF